MIMKVPYLGYSLIPAKLRQLVTLSSILQCQHTFTIFRISKIYRSFAGAAIKNLPANAGDVRDAGLIPGSGRSPGEGHDNPLQYSCLENPVQKGTLWITVHRVSKSLTQLRQLFSTQQSTWLILKVKCQLDTQLCPTICNPMDCNLQAPLSMEFSRQEYWSGLPFPCSRNLPNPGIKPIYVSCIAGRFFTI